MERMQSMIRTAILMFILYVIQFLVFPRLFPNYYRVSNEATALYWLSFAVVVTVGVIKGSDHIIDWIPGNILYLICMKIYSAGGAYNVQLDGLQRMNSLILLLMIYMAEFVVLQILVILIAGLIRKVFHTG
ncbi:MAG: hypothetical protein Q4C20_00680 [Erysipelotrichaceae bacterium]|nr:hypothetical protein [Erysipelotrichaceae bacterium]